MSRDTLSDVLRTVRLRSAVYYYVSCEGTWVAETPASNEIAPAVMPGVERVIEYHVVTEGDCWAAIVGEPPLKLHRGDVILLPHGDAHVISSAPGLRAEPNVGWFYELKRHERPFRVAHSSAPIPPQVRPSAQGFEPPSGACWSTTLVCGFIGCDVRPFNPLLATLPRLLHLPAQEGGDWSAQFVQLAAAESQNRRPGSEALLERLSEMMFVDAVRRHAERMPEQSTGWLAGVRDRFVGRALALLHETPAAPWTVEELASQIGLSRSALAERFTELVGQPPMQYLAQWRMQLASRLLRDTQAPVASIALDVGYDSEAAFSRAFKRLTGVPPAVWRRSQAQSMDPASPPAAAPEPAPAA
jgi:AraC-like DNA-binding protein